MQEVQELKRQAVKNQSSTTPVLRDVPFASTDDAVTATCFDTWPPDYWFCRGVNMRRRDRRAHDMVNGKIFGGAYCGFHYMLDRQEAASAIYLRSMLTKLLEDSSCTSNRKPNTVPWAKGISSITLQLISWRAVSAI
eukprot:gnl/TRDRNA2_/TRDRNA2_173837_c0_seq1.p1 gnl/TRDRNA2_/TRDRNA2_173837_c0~~gnl/TRDRNA2_/TRDRNA2_173837_c0_seq1.p1  ORF type:complete len:137 (-),score=17.50 gnl/TRDRNA2_/TRDRNA2_173837_c0_seq1:197-607(-)